MVRALKPTSVGLSVFHLCSNVEYPAPRVNLSAEVDVGEIMLHLYSLVMNSHMVKVTSCLVCRQ